MTDETRETHAVALDELARTRRGVERGRTTYAGDQRMPAHVALTDAIEAGALALRDVLTPRTCSGCKSRLETTGACYKDVQDPEGEEVENTRSLWNWRNRDTFGCNAWKPRELHH